MFPVKEHLNDHPEIVSLEVIQRVRGLFADRKPYETLRRVADVLCIPNSARSSARRLGTVIGQVKSRICKELRVQGIKPY